NAIERSRGGGLTLRKVVLDPDGRFELLIDAEMRLELQIYGRLDPDTRWLILVEEFDVASTGPHWELELSSASLEGFVALPRDAEGRTGLLHYEANVPGAMIRMSFMPDTEDAFGPVRVPAKRG